jgi:hypothetical protein
VLLQVELRVKSGYAWWRLTLLEFLRWLRQAAGLAPEAITSGRVKPSTPLFRLLLRCIVLYQSWRWFMVRGGWRCRLALLLALLLYQRLCLAAYVPRCAMCIHSCASAWHVVLCIQHASIPQRRMGAPSLAALEVTTTAF